MPRDFSTISQRGVNSRGMNKMISPDPIMTVCVMRVEGVRACLNLNSGTDRADARAAVWMPSLHPSLDPGED